MKWSVPGWAGILVPWEPPRTLRVSLVLAQANAGVCSEAGCSLHSHSSTGRMSLSVLSCPGMQEGVGSYIPHLESLGLVEVFLCIVFKLMF